MDASTKKALIIEDEPSIAGLCKKILKQEGFIADIADNGETAEKLITENDYELILMDIRLPVVSGIDVYIWLQQEYPEVTRNVIFMTGSIMGGETMNLLQSAGRPYLLKPFRPDELKQLIDAFLTNR